MRSAISSLGLFGSMAALALVGVVVLPGCGSGGGGGAEAGGTVSLSVTDSPSDQIDLFEADVQSVTLHRVGGAVVEALPRTERVDFADLVSLSELLTSATVPPGTYKRLALTIDFSTAAVHIDGQTTTATVLDADGNAFTAPATIAVDFPIDKPLVVAPGVTRFVELDFDLDASTEVDATANTVKVGPVLYARAEPSDPKPARAYGRLVSTDTATSTFVFELLTRRRLSRGTEHTVTTDANTKFEVDGTTGQGSAGFALLDAKAAGTRLEIHGILDPAAHKFLAKYVEAGRGVFDGSRDFVEGIVIARTGGAGADATLAVHGVGVDRGTAVTFNRTFAVHVSFADTKVAKFGDGPGSHTTDDVNVGQRIVAFGDLTTIPPVLDATVPGQGFVRLIETAVSGGAAGAVSSGVLTANVFHIDRRPSIAFNFSVDGTALVDPTAMKIGTSTLSLPGIGAGSAIVARGFFVPVNASASGPDFEAISVVDRTGAASVLGVLWSTPSSAPFASASASGVTVDISAAAAAKVDVGFVAPVNLLGGSNPVIAPAGAGGLFAVVEFGAGVTLYHDFDAWRTDVQARLSRAVSPVSARGIAAEGKWDSATTTLTARRLAIHLK